MTFNKLPGARWGKLAAVSSIAVAGLLAFSSPAGAVINAPLPSNTYITLNGLDWAWAKPLPGTAIDLTYQGTQGWRVPTATELLNAPTATMFLFTGANVPFGGTDPISGASFQATNAAYSSAQSAGACASPYFASSFNHCDWQDGLGQTFGPWAGMPGAQTFADQLYVRVSGAVPEPGTWAMMLLGFGSIGFAMRRRRQNLGTAQVA